eukprot:gnl/Chilomastix_cuspidata/5480.p1 GENE.gnl/Chilomastix_cuspidata/5480~~gnl/Chilomastix_cuspidata/5480.p1  ORF type:complete len:4682 (-),score=1272.65 gnl/Chilomastix_cuspidata/5480:19-14064(-)
MTLTKRLDPSTMRKRPELGPCEVPFQFRVPPTIARTISGSDFEQLARSPSPPLNRSKETVTRRSKSVIGTIYRRKTAPEPINIRRLAPSRIQWRPTTAIISSFLPRNRTRPERPRTISDFDTVARIGFASTVLPPIAPRPQTPLHPQMQMETRKFDGRLFLESLGDAEFQDFDIGSGMYTIRLRSGLLTRVLPDMIPLKQLEKQALEILLQTFSKEERRDPLHNAIPQYLRQLTKEEKANLENIMSRAAEFRSELLAKYKDSAPHPLPAFPPSVIINAADKAYENIRRNIANWHYRHIIVGSSKSLFGKAITYAKDLPVPELLRGACSRSKYLHAQFVVYLKIASDPTHPLFFTLPTFFSRLRPQQVAPPSISEIKKKEKQNIASLLLRFSPHVSPHISPIVQEQLDLIYEDLEAIDISPYTVVTCSQMSFAAQRVATRQAAFLMSIYSIFGKLKIFFDTVRATMKETINLAFTKFIQDEVRIEMTRLEKKQTNDLLEIVKGERKAIAMSSKMKSSRLFEQIRAKSTHQFQRLCKGMSFCVGSHIQTLLADMLGPWNTVIARLDPTQYNPPVPTKVLRHKQKSRRVSMADRWKKIQHKSLTSTKRTPKASDAIEGVIGALPKQLDTFSILQYISPILSVVPPNVLPKDPVEWKRIVEKERLTTRAMVSFMSCRILPEICIKFDVKRLPPRLKLKCPDSISNQVYAERSMAKFFTSADAELVHKSTASQRVSTMPQLSAHSRRSQQSQKSQDMPTSPLAKAAPSFARENQHRYRSTNSIVALLYDQTDEKLQLDSFFIKNISVASKPSPQDAYGLLPEIMKKLENLLAGFPLNNISVYEDNTNLFVHLFPPTEETQPSPGVTAPPSVKQPIPSEESGASFSTTFRSISTPQLLSVESVPEKVPAFSSSDIRRSTGVRHQSVAQEFYKSYNITQEIISRVILRLTELFEDLGQDDDSMDIKLERPDSSDLSQEPPKELQNISELFDKLKTSMKKSLKLIEAFSILPDLCYCGIQRLSFRSFKKQAIPFLRMRHDRLSVALLRVFVQAMQFFHNTTNATREKLENVPANPTELQELLDIASGTRFQKEKWELIFTELQKAEMMLGELHISLPHSTVLMFLQNKTLLPSIVMLLDDVESRAPEQREQFKREIEGLVKTLGKYTSDIAPETEKTQELTSKEILQGKIKDMGSFSLMNKPDGDNTERDDIFTTKTPPVISSRTRNIVESINFALPDISRSRMIGGLSLQLVRNEGRRWAEIDNNMGTVGRGVSQLRTILGTTSKSLQLLENWQKSLGIKDEGDVSGAISKTFNLIEDVTPLSDLVEAFTDLVSGHSKWSEQPLEELEVSSIRATLKDAYEAMQAGFDKLPEGHPNRSIAEGMGKRLAEIMPEIDLIELAKSPLFTNSVEAEKVLGMPPDAFLSLPTHEALKANLREKKKEIQQVIEKNHSIATIKNEVRIILEKVHQIRLQVVESEKGSMLQFIDIPEYLLLGVRTLIHRTRMLQQTVGLYSEWDLVNTEILLQRLRQLLVLLSVVQPLVRMVIDLTSSNFFAANAILLNNVRSITSRFRAIIKMISRSTKVIPLIERKTTVEEVFGLMRTIHAFIADLIKKDFFNTASFKEPLSAFLPALPQSLLTPETFFHNFFFGVVVDSREGFIKGWKPDPDVYSFDVFHPNPSDVSLTTTDESTYDQVEPVASQFQMKMLVFQHSIPVRQPISLLLEDLEKITSETILSQASYVQTSILEENVGILFSVPYAVILVSLYLHSAHEGFSAKLRGFMDKVMRQERRRVLRDASPDCLAAIIAIYQCLQARLPLKIVAEKDDEQRPTIYIQGYDLDFPLGSCFMGPPLFCELEPVPPAILQKVPQILAHISRRQVIQLQTPIFQGLRGLPFGVATLMFLARICCRKIVPFTARTSSYKEFCQTLKRISLCLSAGYWVFISDISSLEKNEFGRIITLAKQFSFSLGSSISVPLDDMTVMRDVPLAAGCALFLENRCVRVQGDLYIPQRMNHEIPGFPVLLALEGPTSEFPEIKSGLVSCLNYVPLAPSVFWKIIRFFDSKEGESRLPRLPSIFLQKLFSSQKNIFSAKSEKSHRQAFILSAFMYYAFGKQPSAIAAALGLGKEGVELLMREVSEMWGKLLSMAKADFNLMVRRIQTIEELEAEAPTARTETRATARSQLSSMDTHRTVSVRNSRMGTRQKESRGSTVETKTTSQKAKKRLMIPTPFSDFAFAIIGLIRHFVSLFNSCGPLYLHPYRQGICDLVEEAARQSGATAYILRSPSDTLNLSVKVPEITRIWIVLDCITTPEEEWTPILSGLNCSFPMIPIAGGACFLPIEAVFMIGMNILILPQDKSDETGALSSRSFISARKSSGNSSHSRFSYRFSTISGIQFNDGKQQYISAFSNTNPLLRIQKPIFVLREGVFSEIIVPFQDPRRLSASNDLALWLEMSVTKLVQYICSNASRFISSDETPWILDETVFLKLLCSLTLIFAMQFNIARYWVVQSSSASEEASVRLKMIRFQPLRFSRRLWVGAIFNALVVFQNFTSYRPTFEELRHLLGLPSTGEEETTTLRFDNFVEKPIGETRDYYFVKPSEPIPPPPTDLLTREPGLPRLTWCCAEFVSTPVTELSFVCCVYMLASCVLGGIPSKLRAADSSRGDGLQFASIENDFSTTLGAAVSSEPDTKFLEDLVLMVCSEILKTSVEPIHAAASQPQHIGMSLQRVGSINEQNMFFTDVEKIIWIVAKGKDVAFETRLLIQNKFLYTFLEAEPISEFARLCLNSNEFVSNDLSVSENIEYSTETLTAQLDATERTALTTTTRVELFGVVTSFLDSDLVGVLDIPLPTLDTSFLLDTFATKFGFSSFSQAQSMFQEIELLASFGNLSILSFFPLLRSNFTREDVVRTALILGVQPNQIPNDFLKDFNASKVLSSSIPYYLSSLNNTSMDGIVVPFSNFFERADNANGDDIFVAKEYPLYPRPKMFGTVISPQTRRDVFKHYNTGKNHVLIVDGDAPKLANGSQLGPDYKAPIKHHGATGTASNTSQFGLSASSKKLLSSYEGLLGNCCFSQIITDSAQIGPDAVPLDMLFVHAIASAIGVEPQGLEGRMALLRDYPPLRKSEVHSYLPGRKVLFVVHSSTLQADTPEARRLRKSVISFASGSVEGLIPISDEELFMSEFAMHIGHSKLRLHLKHIMNYAWENMAVLVLINSSAVSIPKELFTFPPFTTDFTSQLVLSHFFNSKVDDLPSIKTAIIETRARLDICRSCAEKTLDLELPFVYQAVQTYFDHVMRGVESNPEKKVSPSDFPPLVLFLSVSLHFRAVVQEASRNNRESYTRMIDNLNAFKDMVNDADMLAEITARLENIQKQLEQTIAEINATGVEMNKKKREIEKTRRTAQNREKLIVKAKEAIDVKLSAFNKTLNKTREQLKRFTKQDLAELRSMATPPITVILVAEAVAQFLDLIPAPSGGSVLNAKREEELREFWVKGRNMFGDASFLKTITSPEVLSNERSIKKLRPYVKLDGFDPESLTRVSIAAKSLCSWIHASVSFNDAEKKVKPLRIERSKQMKMLSDEQRLIKKANAELDEIRRRYEEADRTKQALLEEQRVSNEELDEKRKKLAYLQSVLECLEKETDTWEREEAEEQDIFLRSEENAIAMARGLCFGDYSEFVSHSITEPPAPLSVYARALMDLNHDGAGRYVVGPDGKKEDLFVPFSRRKLVQPHAGIDPHDMTYAMMAGMVMALGMVPLLLPGMGTNPALHSIRVSELPRKRPEKPATQPYFGYILEVGDTLSGQEIHTINTVLASKLTGMLSTSVLTFATGTAMKMPSSGESFFIALRVQRDVDVNFVMNAISPSLRAFLVPIHRVAKVVVLPSVAYRIFEKEEALEAVNDLRTYQRARYAIKTDRENMCDLIEGGGLDSHALIKLLQTLEEKEASSSNLKEKIRHVDAKVAAFRRIFPLAQRLSGALHDCAEKLSLPSLNAIADPAFAIDRIFDLKKQPLGPPSNFYTKSPRNLVELGHFILNQYVQATFVLLPRREAIVVAFILIVRFEHFFGELDNPDSFLRSLFASSESSDAMTPLTLPKFFSADTRVELDFFEKLADTAVSRIGGYERFPPTFQTQRAYESPLPHFRTLAFKKSEDDHTQEDQAAFLKTGSPLRMLAVLSALGYRPTSEELLEVLKMLNLAHSGLRKTPKRTWLFTKRAQQLHGSIQLASERSNKLVIVISPPGYDPTHELFNTISALEKVYKEPLIVSALDLDLVFKLNSRRPLIILTDCADAETSEYLSAILSSSDSRNLRVVVASESCESLKPLFRPAELVRLGFPQSFEEALGMAVFSFAFHSATMDWSSRIGEDVTRALLFSHASFLVEKNPRDAVHQAFNDVYKLLAAPPSRRMHSGSWKIASNSRASGWAKKDDTLTPTAERKAQILTVVRASLGSQYFADRIDAVTAQRRIRLARAVNFAGFPELMPPPDLLQASLTLGAELSPVFSPLELPKLLGKYLHSRTRRQLSFAHFQPMNVLSAIEPLIFLRERTEQLQAPPGAPTPSVSSESVAQLKLNACLLGNLKLGDYQLNLQTTTSPLAIATCACRLHGAFLDDASVFSPTDSYFGDTFKGYICLASSYAAPTQVSAPAAVDEGTAADGAERNTGIRLPVKNFPELVFFYRPEHDKFSKPLEFFQARNCYVTVLRP